jgi:phosphoribosylformylglycinamidine synthase
MIESGVVTAVHDVSDGGIGVALAEMALAGNIGATIGSHDADVPLHAWLFGEDQGRYIITCPMAKAAELEFQLNSLQVVTTFVGIVGGETLTLPGEAPISLKELRDAHEGWLPAYMGAEAAE